MTIQMRVAQTKKSCMCISAQFQGALPCYANCWLQIRRSVPIDTFKTLVVIGLSANSSTSGFRQQRADRSSGLSAWSVDSKRRWTSVYHFRRSEAL